MTREATSLPLMCSLECVSAETKISFQDFLVFPSFFVPFLVLLVVQEPRHQERANRSFTLAKLTQAFPGSLGESFSTERNWRFPAALICCQETSDDGEHVTTHELRPVGVREIAF